MIESSASKIRLLKNCLLIGEGKIIIGFHFGATNIYVTLIKISKKKFVIIWIIQINGDWDWQSQSHHFFCYYFEVSKKEYSF